MAVVEHNGSYLIGLRPDGVPLAGYWEFPGGKVQDGELPEQAAVRECLEEAGLEVRVTGSYLPADHDYDYARVRLLFFACASGKQRRPLPRRFRWVPASELSHYRFPPANAALLGQLASADAGR